ncbi:AGC/PDK1 protein kinase, variant [Aphanomyces invadans]|uniref:non-specific serine/threonine protein kinase n=1 Tax=Aphanomyces invadans TaxID=157072 RepID=A0A024TWC6_9STRA|nr:AGC/PDK1 protein kinase, variant [Aphanomyces invadans]ETV97896.1 AGC/PDK1 protein kinase, variant [Aphanomyces invadans]|eukprot:XP_008873457.1 AGC/PDK1 protein kinase, variant [Aphanomyces invadans]
MVCAMTPSRSSNSAAPSSSSQARAGMSPSDFVFGSVLGQGSFAKVYHAQFKKTKANFAVKVMDQEFIKKHDKVPFVVMERQVMSKLSHPNIVKFYCSFKDDESLYMVMELCRGGELLSYICKERDAAKAQGLLDTACSVPVVQFYMAQLIVALQYIHSNQVIHRDLKPDNILFSEQGHLKVTDFGTATLTDSNEHATKFCGTAEYLSPEVLNDMPVGVGSDLWAVGCILFQMLTGRPPFRGETDFLTFQQILSHDSATMEFPAHVPETARDLIRQLLVLNLDARLIDYDAIQAHPFFTGIDWPNISKATPPVVPEKVDLPTPTMDGASPNWSLANVLNDVFGATALVADGPTDLHLLYVLKDQRTCAINVPQSSQQPIATEPSVVAH